MLMACLKFLAKCLCPRCLALKEDVADIGTPEDMSSRKKKRVDCRFYHDLIAKARKLIYNKGRPLTSETVDKKLANFSLVPTRVRCFHQRV